MNEPQTKRQKTHAKMLDAAGRSFRSHGYAGIGVDGIANAAGVTSGAFYAHFGSKDGAFQAALAAGLDEVIEAIPQFQQQHESKWVSAFANYYLGQPHQDDLAGGCAMTTLTPEVVRAKPELQKIYQTKMKNIVRLLAIGLAGDTQQHKEANAWAMLATLIGGLNLLRAVADKKMAKQMASSIKTAAIRSAGEALCVFAK